MDAQQALQAAKDLELGEGPFTVGGRLFRNPESKSIAQEAWIERRYRSSGLTRMAQASGASDESVEDLSERLFWESLESGEAYELLAGLLVEEGTAWSRERAQQNAVWFSQLSAKEDRDFVYNALTGLLFRFLAVAAVSKLISLSSSLVPSARRDDRHDGDARDEAETTVNTVANTTVNTTLADPEE